MPDRSVPATPAVPPTPPVPLAALLAREDLALRQIAGPSGPQVAVHWAHTSEMSDPYPYLLGGELLLTAGVHIPEAAASDGGAPGRAGPGDYFDAYVSRIVAAGGAALGFGVAPVHDTVPRALVAACEAYGLPLVEVPPQTTFSAVARAVWQLMAQARLAELRRVTEAQRSLASAAARPDPVPAVLRRLAQRLGGRACLYGPDGTEIASAGQPPEEDVRTALTHLTQVVRPLPHTPRPTPEQPLRDQPPGNPPPSSHTPAPPDLAPAPAEEAAPSAEPAQAAAPVRTCADDRTPPPLTASTPSTAAAPATGGTGAVTQHAPEPATLAQAVDPGRTHFAGHASAPTTTPGPATATASSRTGPGTRPGAVDRARGVVAGGGGAGGRVGPASATDALGGTHLAAYSLGNGQGFVLGVAVPGREAGDHTIASVAAVLLSLLTGEHQSGAGAARSAALVRLLLGAAPQDVAPLLGDGPWLVVHARPQTQAPDAVAGSALGAALGSALVDAGRDVVRVLVPADREPAPQPGWTLGVSAPAAPHEWPAADTQAARALTRARVTAAALVRHGGRAGLAGLVPADEAEGFARELLAPLAGRPALAETLRSWLSLHGSWDRTAVALGVHRNTVRQRIGRCAALLGADLDDPDVRMELWFALKHGE
ncbi:helix-turn-helix domain-containing protein [Streptomyces sp. NPDC102462]|uniref:helix-turn-helix domain-containing protein n=1 Tax=Streptomyces sp. NPDC102462 TaxID=3366178 RepID=UPI0037FCCB09